MIGRSDFEVEVSDEDLSIGRPDVEVEVSENFMPTSPSMSLCPSTNKVSAKFGVVTPSAVELGHAKPAAMLFPDGGVNLGPLESITPSVPDLLDHPWCQRLGGCAPYLSSTGRASIDRAGPTTSASTMINSPSRTKELESLVIDDQRWPDQLGGLHFGRTGR